MAKLSRRSLASSSTTASTATGSSSPSTPTNLHSSVATSKSANSSRIAQNQKIAHAYDRSSKLNAGNVNGLSFSSLRMDTSVYPDAIQHDFDAGAEYTTRYNYNNYAPSVTNFSSQTTFSSTALPIPTTLDSSSSSSSGPSLLPPLFLPNKTSTVQILAAERARMRAEFFATYDVMTGVRIAATLSGFFGLMVFLIVWKSRSSSNETLKVLKDPKMAAVAAVCMQEEEERKIQEAMVATGMSIYPDEYDAILYRRQRMLSLGNVSAPPILHRGYRFSSVGGGGYSSLLEPPRRFSYSNGGKSASSLIINTVNGDGGGAAGDENGVCRKSGSDSLRILSNYPVGNSFTADDYFMETEDEFECVDYAGDSGKQLINSNDDHDHHKRSDSKKSNTSGFLAVPQGGYDSRRSSAMTCCSTDSSYLERRCSAFTLGLGNLPASLQRKLSTTSRTSGTDNWDYYYPDIQIIQPTPKTSPSPSQRSTSQNQIDAEETKPPPPPIQTPDVTTAKTATTTATTPRSSLVVKTRDSKAIKTVPKPNTAANIELSAANQPKSFVRKHSIAYYDPESAQIGGQQQIHSISSDIIDLFPYNRDNTATRINTRTKRSIYYNESSAAVAELHESLNSDIDPASTYHESNNNFFNNASTVATTSTPVQHSSVQVTNSSSLSMDSTPVSIEKLNGSGSLGTAKILFNSEKRAPLASLSSFKISSLEYQDSDMHSLDENSVFGGSIADTDEDMRQLSSESEEASLDEAMAAPSAVETIETLKEIPSRLTVLSENFQTYSVDETRLSAFSSNPSERLGSSGRAARRPSLQRHRTISASSNNRSPLIGQQLKEFPAAPNHGYSSVGVGGDAGTSDTQSCSTKLELAASSLETHFGTNIITNSPPAVQSRRGQLLQQFSDPHSLPTTTTTTEDETCSTLNTDEGTVTALAFDTLTPQRHYQDQKALPHQNSESDRCSPQSDMSGRVHDISGQVARKQRYSPHSRVVDETCCRSSSLTDSVVVAITNQTAQTNINVPSSLKNLILRGSTAAGQTSERSTQKDKNTKSNLSSNLEDEMESGTSVILELPLIKLPSSNGESTESSSAGSNELECSRSISDESRDPSLPGTARKWSRETLF